MLEAVIFDWAGTLVDFGSRAPLKAFITLFSQYDVTISEAEARKPMGTEKRDHIIALLNDPAISQRWMERHDCLPDEAKIDQMYQKLIPLQVEQISTHSNLVPGVVTTLKQLRERQLKIGTTTGYGRAMIGEMVDQAERQGFSPDCIVTADDVGLGRPSAAAALSNLVQLKVDSVRHCVKVDDTVPGVLEGRNAGMWTVAVAITGNALGWSESDWLALSPVEQKQYKAQAYRNLELSGAHYIIDSVAELEPVLTDIETRLARGETP